MDKSSILVIGDSISLHYTPYLKALCSEEEISCIHYGEDNTVLDGEIRKGWNCRSSAEVLEIVRGLDSTSCYTAVLFNCGLHDIMRDIGDNQLHVSLSEYRKNLVQIIKLLRKSSESIPIWVNSTPVDTEIHSRRSDQFRRRGEDLIRYNEAATALMRSTSVPEIDLYTFTKQTGFPGSLADHVHYNDEARRLQAGFIFREIKMILATPTTSGDSQHDQSG